MYTPLSPKRVQEIEEEIDDVLRSCALPGQSLADARWLLATTCEDILRIVFARAAPHWTDVTALEQRANEIHRLDEIKYLLRIALLKVDKEKKSGAWREKFFSRSKDRRYGEIAKFLFGIARFYMKAVGIYSWINNEGAHAWGYERENKILMVPSIRELQYRMVEALIVEDVDPHTPLPFLAASFLGEEFVMQDGSVLLQGAHGRKAIGSVKLRNGKLSYPFVKSRLKSLYEILLYRPAIIPDK